MHGHLNVKFVLQRSDDLGVILKKEIFREDIMVFYTCLKKS